MKKRFSFTLVSVLVFGIMFAQTFELGSGFFFYRVTGNVLMSDYTGAWKKQTVDNRLFLPMGASFNYYHPFLAKSSESSVGILTGFSAFFRLQTELKHTQNYSLYGNQQLGHKPSIPMGFQVPVLLNVRLGRNATSNSTSAIGIALGGGIMANGFAYDNYYFDRFINFPPVVNADLALGRVRFRLMYLLSSYKTYYVYDTGKKETKYDFSQFSITANITLGDD